MLDRPALINDSLKRNGLHPALRARIEGLLDGRENRACLRCCAGNCLVCVHTLLAVVREVEEAQGIVAPAHPQDG
jgi:hypothetical protein